MFVQRPYPADVRFWNKVNKNGPVALNMDTPCWLWTASLTYNGYGQFSSTAKKTVKAHRWLWEQENGKVPEGLELDHLCRVRSCIRPSHLEAVTHSINSQRGNVGNTVVGELQRRKTHCSQGHPYDSVNTCHYRGERRCRTCSREAARVRRAS